MSFLELAQLVMGRHYEEEYYALIGSFMDESFDPKPRGGVFAVGGLLGRGAATFELERKWEQLRQRPDIDIQFYKASQCERPSGQFEKFAANPEHVTPQERERLESISHEFLSLIAMNGYLTAQGVGVVQEDFYEVIQEDRARAILGDSPYRLAYDLAMIQCAWAMKELGTGDSVSFVCDEHERYGAIAPEAYMKLKLGNPNAAKYMATFSMGHDEISDLLQAADAVVFEIRRALNLALGQWPGQLRKQFGILADSKKMFLITHATKEQLLHIVATHEPGEPFKLDEMMNQEFHENIKITL
jgi:hypothetical protein